MKHMRYRHRRRKEENLCRTRHFAVPSQLIGLPKATVAIGATSLLSINSLPLVESIITRLDFFVRSVVRNSLTLSVNPNSLTLKVEQLFKCQIPTEALLPDLCFLLMILCAQ